MEIITTRLQPTCGIDATQKTVSLSYFHLPPIHPRTPNLRPFSELAARPDTEMQPLPREIAAAPDTHLQSHPIRNCSQTRPIFASTPNRRFPAKSAFSVTSHPMPLSATNCKINTPAQGLRVFVRTKNPLQTPISPAKPVLDRPSPARGSRPSALRSVHRTRNSVQPPSTIVHRRVTPFQRPLTSVQRALTVVQRALPPAQSPLNVVQRPLPPLQTPQTLSQLRLEVVQRPLNCIQLPITPVQRPHNWLKLTSSIPR